VAKSDPPDPARIAEDARVLLEGGDLSTDAAIEGLSAILQELRNVYGMSEDALAPIADLIRKLRKTDHEPSSG
jgi:hypothetical protein